jgi:hypothetical protein
MDGIANLEDPSLHRLVHVQYAQLLTIRETDARVCSFVKTDHGWYVKVQLDTYRPVQEKCQCVKTTRFLQNGNIEISINIGAGIEESHTSTDMQVLLDTSTCAYISLAELRYPRSYYTACRGNTYGNSRIGWVCPTKLCVTTREMFVKNGLFCSETLTALFLNHVDAGQRGSTNINSDQAALAKQLQSLFSVDKPKDFLENWRNNPTEQNTLGDNGGVLNDMLSILQVESAYVGLLSSIIILDTRLVTGLLFNPVGEMTDTEQIVDILNYQWGREGKELPWDKWETILPPMHVISRALRLPSKADQDARDVSVASVFAFTGANWTRWGVAPPPSIEHTLYHSASYPSLANGSMVQLTSVALRTAHECANVESCAWDFRREAHGQDAARSPLDELSAMYARSMYTKVGSKEGKEVAFWFVSSQAAAATSAQALLVVDTYRDHVMLLDFAHRYDKREERVYERIESLQLPARCWCPLGAFTREELEGILSTHFRKLVFSWMSVSHKGMFLVFHGRHCIPPPMRLNRNLSNLPLNLHAFFTTFCAQDIRPDQAWDADKQVVLGMLKRSANTARAAFDQLNPVRPEAYAGGAADACGGENEFAALFQMAKPLHVLGLWCAADILYLLTTDVFSVMRVQTWTEASRLAHLLFLMLVWRPDQDNALQMGQIKQQLSGPVEGVYTRWNTSKSTAVENYLISFVKQTCPAVCVRTKFTQPRCDTIVSPAELTNHRFLVPTAHMRKQFKVTVHRAGTVNNRYPPEKLCHVAALACARSVKINANQQLATSLWEMFCKLPFDNSTLNDFEFNALVDEFCKCEEI